mmetsp:Transcript_20040/g.23944  ORF Transcript_20040/g.23944 Transcript_20040/m.23944 type:complete len:445 (-) Transcript_20040:2074-3408(-)
MGRSNDYNFDDISEVGGILESVAEDSVLESVADESILSSSKSTSSHRNTTADAITRARELLASAKSMKRNISSDSLSLGLAAPNISARDDSLLSNAKSLPINLGSDEVGSTKGVILFPSKDSCTTDIDVATPPECSISNDSREENISPPLPPIFIQECGRYHLFIAHACPWSHRTSVVRALKGLEDVIGMSYVNCIWDPLSLWDSRFKSEVESDVSFWSITDSIHEKSTEDSESEELIFQAFKDEVLDMINGPIQVPVLWDKRKKCIISNSSVEIMWILNFEFNKWAKQAKLNLFPPGSKGKNDDVNQWIHNSINIGVYRCGVATSQDNYDEAVNELTRALDKADAIVKKRGFLAGKSLTESDIRLFVTLIRFDEVYRLLFKTNTRRISKMSGLLTYARDIYQVKKVKETCNMGAIKKAYYGARTEVGIVPRGEGFLEILGRNE